MRQQIKDSGIYVREFAELCGVTRIAVYAWLDGGAIHLARKRRVDKVLEAMASAVEAGDLPIKRPSKKFVDQTAQTKVVTDIIVKHLQLLSQGS